jgi:N6-adenosine-specific RNA methylase IME4
MVAHIDVHGRFGTILADPPWQFQNRTGKVAPEHRRLRRYKTMSLAEICALPVANFAAEQSHLYLWCPNALLPEGLEVLRAWGFRYKSNVVWFKVRKDGGADGRGVGFYFRNVTELLLFGVRGKLRTLAPGRRQVNLIATRKQEHSRKPEEAYGLIESCSPGPYLELFARERRKGWTAWGDEADTYMKSRRNHPGYAGHVSKPESTGTGRVRRRALPKPYHLVAEVLDSLESSGEEARAFACERRRLKSALRLLRSGN